MLMETFMMGIGRTTRPMAMDNILILMELNMKVTGLMISSMDKEKSTGQMVHNMKATTNLEKRMGLVNFYGLTNLLIVVTLWTIIFMVVGSIDGPISESTLEIGFRTKCMDPESSRGPMGENMKENIMMTKNKVMEFSLGQMEDNTMVIG